MSDPLLKSRHNEVQQSYEVIALQEVRRLLFARSFYIGAGCYRVDRLSSDEVNASLPEGNVRGPWLPNEDCQSEMRDMSVIQDELQKPKAFIEHSLYNLFGMQWPTHAVINYSMDDYFAEEGQDVEDLTNPAIEIKSQQNPQELAEAILKSDSSLDSANLRNFILAAEDADFSREISSKLGPRLLDFAMKHRDSNDSELVPVVLSAIRTSASMTEPIAAGRLLPLLEPGHSIETSLVALKMLGRVFEAQPPAGVDLYQDLAPEISVIADSFLNRYAISIPQSAAMANLAIYALASMASNELLAVVDRVRSLDVSWFTQRAVRELNRLRGLWLNRAGQASQRALGLLDQAISVLSREQQVMTPERGS